MTSNAACVLIMCGGNGQRWANYMGILKQQISFGGETLLERTVRLLQERDVADITVVLGKNSMLAWDKTRIMEVRSSGWITEGLEETQRKWRGRTIILLGDVFYTEPAIDRILSSNISPVFFGRSGASLRTGKPYRELFGMGFDVSSADQILKALENVHQHTISGGGGRLWQLYSTVVGFPLNQSRVEQKHFLEINDFTDDFDLPQDYRRARRRFAVRASGAPLSHVALWVMVACSAPAWWAKRWRRALRRWLREKFMPGLRRNVGLLLGEERVQRWLVIIYALINRA